MIKIRNITLSAEDVAIEKARIKAKKEGKSLNSKFREWLKQYTSPKKNSSNYDTIMDSLKYVNPGQKFTREEANER